MIVEVVTSFSQQGAELYGEPLIASLRAYWPHARLRIAYESKHPSWSLRYPGIEWRDLLCDTDLSSFLRLCEKHPRSLSVDPRYGCSKWARKVFALSAPWASDLEWLVWIDGDVVLERAIDDAFLGRVLPSHKALTYLGRRDYRYSECGFVAYRASHPLAKSLLQRMRAIYATGEVFGLPEWGDSYVFDFARRRLAAPEVCNDLAKDVHGKTHVWPDTILGRYMTHHKGPKRKTVAYGGTC